MTIPFHYTPTSKQSPDLHDRGDLLECRGSYKSSAHGSRVQHCAAHVTAHHAVIRTPNSATVPAAEGKACPAHPVSRAALQGHVFRRYVRAAVSLERR